MKRVTAWAGTCLVLGGMTTAVSLSVQTMRGGSSGLCVVLGIFLGVFVSLSCTGASLWISGSR